MSDAIVVNGRFLRAATTGLQRVARSLLVAADGLGFDRTVVAPSDVDDPLVDHRLPAPAGRHGDQLWEQVLLPAYAGRRPILSLTNTAPLAARHGIVMVHDLAPLVGPAWFNRQMRGYGRLVLAAARRADQVLTVSQAVRTELLDRGVTSPITVIRPAVDPALRPADTLDIERVQRRLGLHRPYLLLVGWADPRKDMVTAVGAHLLARESVAHDLVLVGRQHPMFAPLTAPTIDSVHLAGYVGDDDLRALLSGAAALVYPTRYEGFGLPPLEAWACGRPALVSDLPVLRESTNGAATYVEPGHVTAWAAAMVAALRGEISAPAPDTRTPDDAARELLAALAPATAAGRARENRPPSP